MSVCQCGRSIGIGLLCWYGTVHERGGQSWMSSGVHALTVIENVSLSQSHIAKGPEIEARHRLVPAVGIMRLVAGQARLVR